MAGGAVCRRRLFGIRQIDRLSLTELPRHGGSSVIFKGQDISLLLEKMNRTVGSEIAMIFQETMTALNQAPHRVETTSQISRCGCARVRSPRQSIENWQSAAASGLP
jgi:ABC-type microcin C transport system duplicated ATPase subunit YejF